MLGKIVTKCRQNLGLLVSITFSVTELSLPVTELELFLTHRQVATFGDLTETRLYVINVIGSSS